MNGEIPTMHEVQAEKTGLVMPVKALVLEKGERSNTSLSFLSSCPNVYIWVLVYSSKEKGRVDNMVIFVLPHRDKKPTDWIPYSQRYCA